ncbi:B12-binding domain-containing radical SAM protein [bacterium]|nr:B12-binding domain-containing radical SAM protein [bacterium]
MKLLLIRPAKEKLTLDSRSYKKRLGEKHQPLGLMYLAAVLAKNNHEIAISDELVGDNSEKMMQDFNPDILGITVTTPMMDRAKEISKEAKKSGTTVILGGPHISAIPIKVLEDSDADIAVFGEGEHTIVDICSGKVLEDIEGIAYKDGTGVIIQNPPRKLIEDLDSLPFPSRKHINLQKYIESEFELGFPLKKGDTLMRMFSSRGCPYLCTFCASHNVFGRKFRTRSIDNIIEEMRLLIDKYGYKNFVFMDDHFALKDDRVVQFCERVLEKLPKVRWLCSARADISPDTLKLMKKAGCEMISFGIESGSEKILRTVKKKMNLDTIRETFQVCRKIGIRTKTTWIIGVPGEDEDDFQRTVKFACEINPNYIWVSMFYPFPGTESYKNMLEQKGSVDTEAMSYFHSNDPVIQRRHREFLRKFHIRYGFIKNVLFSLSWQEKYDLFRMAKAYIFLNRS